VTGQKQRPAFIVKPEASCQGRGIYLTMNPQVDIQLGEHCVVQHYLNKPYLMEDLKFDLRIYVMVAGVDPLRIFLYREGLTRLATEPYVEADWDNI
jgi:tubulin polyglutamylase TTLL6/13